VNERYEDLQTWARAPVLTNPPETEDLPPNSVRARGSWSPADITQPLPPVAAPSTSLWQSGTTRKQEVTKPDLQQEAWSPLLPSSPAGPSRDWETFTQGQARSARLANHLSKHVQPSRTEQPASSPTTLSLETMLGAVAGSLIFLLLLLAALLIFLLPRLLARTKPAPGPELPEVTAANPRVPCDQVAPSNVGPYVTFSPVQRTR